MSVLAPRVVLTSGSGSFPGLELAMAAHGCTLDRLPLLEFDVPESWDPVDAALERLHEFDAIAITSPRAAEAIVDRAKYLELRASAIPLWTGTSSGGILDGHFTDLRFPDSGALRTRGLAIAIAEEIRADGAQRVLFPCGEVRRQELPQLLAAAGRQVESVICYRTRMAHPDATAAVLRQASVIVVTSPAIAQLLAAGRPAEIAPLLIAIGPTTAEAATAAGWVPDAVADRPAAASIADALQSLLMRRS